MEAAPSALVVDDNAVLLLHATQILEEAGFSTLTAHNGDAALKVLEKHADKVVLLFTDVEMPGSLDGFELARTAASFWPNLGILVASGQVVPQEGDLPAGAIFVAKPFSANVIYDRVHRLVSEEQKPEPLKELP